MLDYNSILSDCGVGKLTSSLVVKNIANLEVLYNEAELVSIYNYFLLNVEDPEILIQVIKLTDEHHAETTLSILLEMLQFKSDEDNESFINVRTMCVRTIANYKDTSTVTALLNCMNNKKENYKVRLACADALGRIGDRYAVKPLLDLVEDDEEKSVYLKESAAFALGMIGDMKAVDPLVNILETKKGIIDKFTFLKERAIEALSKIDFKKNDRVFNALKNSLNDESVQVRVNAIEALSNTDDSRVPDILYSCLTDKSEEVVRNAIIALFNILGEDILYKILNDYSLPEHTMKQVREVIKEVEEADDEEDE